LVVLLRDQLESFLFRIESPWRLFNLLVAGREQGEVLLRLLGRSFGQEGVEVEEVALRTREWALLPSDHGVVPTNKVVPGR